jgi:hypothetical protein
MPTLTLMATRLAEALGQEFTALGRLEPSKETGPLVCILRNNDP